MEKDDKENKLSDLFKKVSSQVVKDLPINLEGLTGMMDSVKQTKEVIVQVVKNEVKAQMDKLDLSKEIERIIQNYDFEVNAKISLKKKNKDEPK